MKREIKEYFYIPIKDNKIIIDTHGKARIYTSIKSLVTNIRDYEYILEYKLKSQIKRGKLNEKISTE